MIARGFSMGASRPTKMEAKETLFHINWGDRDNTFIIAPDEKTARERMPDGKDMVNSVVKLDALYKMIFKAGYEKRKEEVEMVTISLAEMCLKHRKAGIREVVEWMNKNCLGCQSNTLSNKDEYLGFHKESWLTKLKDWGL